MSEEEIIEKANELLTRVTSGYGLAKVDKIHLVLEGLLDLYNKEKEKNEALSATLTLVNIGLENYISKDKINTRIEEIRKIFPNDVMFTREFLITELQALLEKQI